MMKTLELFSGTKSFSKVASANRHETYTIDNQKNLNPDWCGNILEYEFNSVIHSNVDVLWASPPCTTFSVASLGKHWGGGKQIYMPKTESCLNGLRILDKTIEGISIVKPKIWFIENPRGVMRKVIDCFFEKHGITDIKRHTVTYCQYGDNRMKPTDIWTNCDIQFKPPCKNGAPCHEPAPRGSRTGTQGLKGNKERSVIPEQLMIDIIRYCEAIYEVV